MPVNYQQVQLQIKEMGQNAPRMARDLRERADTGRELLAGFAKDLDYLRGLLEQAAADNPGLRCAAPREEPLDYVFSAPPFGEHLPVLLAADGSQVNPNRHDAVEFGLINVGVFRICPGRPLAPSEQVRTTLLYAQDLDSEQERLTEELVALKRDLTERKTLADLAALEPQPVITLTDGPLELFLQSRDDRRLDEQFDQYLDVLEELAAMNVATAGYVDKPSSDLVVRLLELVKLRDRPSAAGRERPLRGLTDAALFADLLGPGQRSAVFTIHSRTSQRFAERLGGALELCFFYLNVGRPDHPSLARVEIPEWVARQPYLLNLLHAALVQQCAQMAGAAYPYALHRAHEVALVTMTDKRQVAGLIWAELWKNGVIPGDMSNKQYLKDLPERGRRSS